MKFASAVTLTTAISIMSAVHGAPIASSQDATEAGPPIHYRRHSSVSELADRNLQGHGDIMSNLNAAFEPAENGIKSLLSFVKRQLGGSSSGTATISGSAPTHYNSEGSEPANNGGAGLMGGGISSLPDAGFAFEPGQGIKATV